MPTKRPAQMPAPTLFRKVVIAIPAKNEAERLPKCLAALAGQRSASTGCFGVLIFANDCGDNTAEIARSIGADAPFDLRVVEAQLPPEHAHAGGARRAAMDLASDWLVEGRASDGLILTTDADSQPGPDWLGANLQAFEEGADAVLGRIAFDEESHWLPPALRARGKLEAVYEDLLTEISARLDPQAANPWPHHGTVSGASLGVTRRMYEAVGGLPSIPLGEEKAFVALLRRHDARIRFAPDVHVVTSGRPAGRAAGGVADTLQLRSREPATLCDEALELCATAFLRALWRGRLRHEGFSGNRWVGALRISGAAAAKAREAPTFGAGWDAVEQASPRLIRRGVSPTQLPAQIEVAMRALRRLQARLADRQDIKPVLGTTLAVRDVDPIA